MAMIATAWSVTIMAQKNAQPAEEAFGQRLARIRKERGFTQTELGDAIGVSQRVISYYERATQRPPAELLPKIAAVLGVTTDVLLGVEALPEDGRTVDARLRRKLKELESLPTKDRKAIMQVIDAMLERQKVNNS